MTVSTPNCSSLVFTTNEITGINDVDLVSLQLTYKFSCGSSVTLNLTDYKNEIVDSSDTETTFTLSVTRLYGDITKTKICEGVYYFGWELIYNDSPDVITYHGSVCSLIDCENFIKCKVKEYVMSTMDVRPIYMLDAIGYASDCDTCDCTSLCGMYNDLLLTLNLNVDATTTGCGCS